MRYSKGEWKYVEELGATFSSVVTQDMVVCGLPNPQYLPEEFEDLQEMRANAQLIALAPKMHQCLVAIKNAMENELRITDSDLGYGIFVSEQTWKRQYVGAIDEVIEGINEQEVK